MWQKSFWAILSDSMVWNSSCLDKKVRDRQTWLIIPSFFQPDRMWFYNKETLSTPLTYSAGNKSWKNVLISTAYYHPQNSCCMLTYHLQYFSREYCCPERAAFPNSNVFFLKERTNPWVIQVFLSADIFTYDELVPSYGIMQTLRLEELISLPRT